MGLSDPSYFETLVPREWLSHGYVERLCLYCQERGVDAKLLYQSLYPLGVNRLSNDVEALEDALQRNDDLHELLSRLKAHEFRRAKRSKAVHDVSIQLLEHVDRQRKNKNSRKSSDGSVSGEAYSTSETLGEPILSFIVVLLLARLFEEGFQCPSPFFELVTKVLGADLFSSGPVPPDDMRYKIASELYRNPGATPTDIAKKVGCKRQFVSSEMKNRSTPKKRGVCLNQIIEQIQAEEKFKKSVAPYVTLFGNASTSRVPFNYTAAREEIFPTKFRHLLKKFED